MCRPAQKIKLVANFAEQSRARGILHTIGKRHSESATFKELRAIQCAE